MRECAHLMKADQPRNLGYMQLAVIKISHCQITPQLLKYFGEVQPFVPKAFVQVSARSFPDCEQCLPRALFHEESMTRSRSQLSYATGLYRLLSPLAPPRNISGEGH